MTPLQFDTAYRPMWDALSTALDRIEGGVRRRRADAKIFGGLRSRQQRTSALYVVGRLPGSQVSRYAHHLSAPYGKETGQTDTTTPG